MPDIIAATVASAVSRPFRAASGALMSVALAIGMTGEAAAQGALSTGDAAVTQFSGYERAPDGAPRPDPDGAVFRALGLGSPGFPADGSLWENPQVVVSLTAGDIGQVFGIAFDAAEPANIYLSATSAFGLYRDTAGNGWANGMWGAGGGPGTIWKLDAERGYRPQPFAEIGYLDAPNQGAALGDLAFDPWHNQLFVSDLESGLIHRLDVDTGELLESFDHGVDGRASFVDVPSGEDLSLDAVVHDPNSEPRFEDCSIVENGEEMAMPFDSAPECWNYADFRRRVWGLGVFQEPEGEEVRLYYAVWGGSALGSEGWADAGEEALTSVWSVGLAEDGWFDPTDVRREIILPPLDEEDAEAPPPETPPVSDIAFTADGLMLLAERGRPAPYFEEEEYAQLVQPNAARVIRLSRVPSGGWQLDGRYGAGRPQRSDANPPPIRANAAGGVSVGYGYDEAGGLDSGQPEQTVWMTVSPLCSEDAPCEFRGEGGDDRPDIVAGLQGTPIDAQGDLDSESNGLSSSYFVRLTGAGELPGDVGDVEIHTAGQMPQRVVEAPRRIETRRPEPDDDEREAEDEEDAEEDETDEALEPSRLSTDLAVDIEGIEDCEPETPCVFEVAVTNQGPALHDQPLLVTTRIGAGGVSMTGAEPEAWNCDQASGSVYCRQESPRLEPDETTAYTLRLQPGGDHREPQLDVCAAITWPGLSGRERIRAVQAELSARGFDAGPADGILGSRTEEAIRTAQSRYDIAVTGEISGDLVEQLFGAGSFVVGDRNDDNDSDCAVAAVDVPAPPPAPEPVAPAAPTHRDGLSAFHQDFQSQQHEQSTSAPRGRHQAEISFFHARRNSAQHNPATSGPSPIHAQQFSQFHMRYRSSAHDGARSEFVPRHDPVMSQFHRRFDSRIHDIETSGPRRLHDARESRFHNRIRSDFHDGVTSGLPRIHDPRTSGFR